MPQSCQMEFPAHSGPVFALDFHPEEKNRLASGGRDKLIKVTHVISGNVRHFVCIPESGI